MQFFNHYFKEDIAALLHSRKFETKLGERVLTLSSTENWQEQLAKLNANFVIIGIPEDIGIEANFGQKGSANTWNYFLQHFLNTQSNDFLSGEEIVVLGAFDFSSLEAPITANAPNQMERIDALRHAVNTIDDEVEYIVKKVVDAGKIPIIIGGGHNNAYPIIKGTAKGLYKTGALNVAQLNVINVDAHMDYRPLEGRHSGNAFRYAEEDGYLSKYFVLGFHENYISQSVWTDFVNNPTFDAISYEDIFLKEKCSFLDAMVIGFSFTDDAPVGIEIDADAIASTASSAYTPSGIDVNAIRQFAHLAAIKTQPAYLHLSEGAATESNGVGKLYNYIVTDFIKAFMQKDIQEEE
jgi:formiminoglutamase